MDLNERKLRILQAIISDFIHSAEPVGSRTLSKKYDMGISPATIRNEMSDLEDMGFLTHPHTSAGRVPSDKAYRLYVNRFMNKYELPDEEKRAISERLHSNVVELDRTIQHAIRLLSELTNLTAFALTPKQDENIIRNINILPVDPVTVVIMIVSSNGKISNTAVKLPVRYTEEALDLLSKHLTYTYKGKTLSEALTYDIIQTFKTDIVAMDRLTESIMPNFIRTLEEMLDVNLYMEGMTNIFSFPEYNDIDRARTFLEMLSNKECLREALINRDDGIIITIGDENSKDFMHDCSLITATYHVDGKMIGKLGVIGPTRMKYDEVTSIIEYVTDNLSQSFNLTEKEEGKT